MGELRELVERLENLDTRRLHAELIETGARHRLLRHVLQAARRVQQEKRAGRAVEQLAAGVV